MDATELELRRGISTLQSQVEALCDAVDSLLTLSENPGFEATVQSIREDLWRARYPKVVE